MSRLMWIPVCAVIALIGSAQAAIFSVGHINAIGTKGKLRFSNVLADDFRAWQYSQGHYQVPERGYYYLSFHGLSRHKDPLTLAVFRNNEELLAGYGSGTDYSTASNSGLVFLNRGDRISLRIISGFAHESTDPRRNYFTLSGFKIGSGSPGSGIGGPLPVPAFAASPPAGADSQPGGIGITQRFSTFSSASSPPVAGSETEDVDGFRPLTADVGGPA